MVDGAAPLGDLEHPNTEVWAVDYRQNSLILHQSHCVEYLHCLFCRTAATLQLFHSAANHHEIRAVTMRQFGYLDSAIKFNGHIW